MKALSIVLKKYAIFAAVAVWVYLAPIKAALLCVAALPLIDTALAILVALRKVKPQTLVAGLRTVESNGLGLMINKIVRYVAGTVLCFVVDKHLLFDVPVALKILLALIGVRELKSALEHLDELGVSPLFAEAIKQIDPSKKEPPSAP